MNREKEGDTACYRGEALWLDTEGEVDGDDGDEEDDDNNFKDDGDDGYGHNGDVTVVVTIWYTDQCWSMLISCHDESWRAH